MISAFGVEHTGISKARGDLVPPSGRPGKGVVRAEDARAMARNKFTKPIVPKKAVSLLKLTRKV